MYVKIKNIFIFCFEVRGFKILLILIDNKIWLLIVCSRSSCIVAVGYGLVLVFVKNSIYVEKISPFVNWSSELFSHALQFLIGFVLTS